MKFILRHGLRQNLLDPEGPHAVSRFGTCLELTLLTFRWGVGAKRLGLVAHFQPHHSGSWLILSHDMDQDSDQNQPERSYLVKKNLICTFIFM